VWKPGRQKGKPEQLREPDAQSLSGIERPLLQRWLRRTLCLDYRCLLSCFIPDHAQKVVILIRNWQDIRTLRMSTLSTTYCECLYGSNTSQIQLFGSLYQS
jgi:hypothetical protein